MAKRIIKTVLFVVGLVVLIGTAGASDLNQISGARIVLQNAAGLIMIAWGGLAKC